MYVLIKLEHNLRAYLLGLLEFPMENRTGC